MKKIIKKAILLLLSLNMIISLTACGEPDEYSEEWYKKQIYIDRIAVEHTDNPEDGLKVKMVISENGDKPINEFIILMGYFCDAEGNCIDEVLITDLLLNNEGLSNLHNNTISCEWEDADLTSEYPIAESKYKEILSDIAAFKIEQIIIYYSIDELENGEKDYDYLWIEGDALNYVISPDAYNNDYDEYTKNMEIIKDILL